MGYDRYELVTIGGQTFSLPSSYLDSDRRKQYFALFDSDIKFMEEEKDVLKNFCGSETTTEPKKKTVNEDPAETKAPTTPESKKEAVNEDPAETKAPTTPESKKEAVNEDLTETKPPETTTPETKPPGTTTPGTTTPGTTTPEKPKEKPYLKDEEKKILCALGFDFELLKQLCPYLAEFFDSLPSCSTDTAMLLKKDCETAYFILWSVMFAAQNALQQRLKSQPTGTFLADIRAGIAKQTTQSLFDIHKQRDISFDSVILKQLFTLGFGIQDITKFTEKDIKELFTISRGKIDQETAILGLLTF